MATLPRAGITRVTIDGTPYDLVGSLSYVLNSVTREAAVGMDAVHGYIEKPTPGKIEMTLRDASGLSVSGFQRMTSVNVQVHLANGKTIVGTGMFSTETQEIDASEASIKVSFEGAAVQELS